MNKIYNFTVLIFAITIISCGVSKETMKKIENSKKEMKNFPIDYCNLFPSQSFENWDKDFELYNKFLSNEIMRTQMGLSFMENGIQKWWCPNAARPHIQLDTLTKISDIKKIFGDWRITCNRQVIYTDSAVYAEKKIYRDSKIIYDEKGADLYLEISADKFNIYGNDSLNGKYKKMKKNYEVINGRFLLLYGLSKASSNISFIGIDKDGQMIINSNTVRERKIKGTYITYEAIMTQFILNKINLQQ